MSERRASRDRGSDSRSGPGVNTHIRPRLYRPRDSGGHRSSSHCGIRVASRRGCDRLSGGGCSSRKQRGRSGRRRCGRVGSRHCRRNTARGVDSLGHTRCGNSLSRARSCRRGNRMMVCGWCAWSCCHMNWCWCRCGCLFPLPFCHFHFDSRNQNLFGIIELPHLSLRSSRNGLVS